jgi:gluconolactonase
MRLNRIRTFCLLYVMAIAVASTSLNPLSAQDMQVADILIPNEGWNVVAEGYGFTDGAATDAEGNFYFADVSKGDTINKISVDGKLSVFAKNATRISGMQFGPDGKLYACQGGKPGKIVCFDGNGQLQVLVNDVEPNDLVVSAKGGIYFTETGKAQVTYLAPGSSPVKAGIGPLKPNGITLSLDQQSVAASDYGGENVWVWQIASDGNLQFGQPYMTMRLPAPSQPSKGDGMATDASGRYYVTSAVGLQVFDPTGRMAGVILAPQSKPLVSVEFSGPELSYLYVCCGDKIFRRKTQTQGVLAIKKSN